MKCHDHFQVIKCGNAFVLLYNVKKPGMKNIVLCLAVLLSLTSMAQTKKTQKKGTSTVKKNQAASKKQTAAKSTGPKTYSLQSSGANKAYYNTSAASEINRLYIADPTIKTLNEKANGGDVKIGSTGIVGAPKGTYGFANGHILFYTTSSTSIGGITGSGAVGTGSNPGNFGSGGQVNGVNGKSPFAGPGMYGTRLPELTKPSPVRDTTRQ
jgi:hypothetical protein